MSRTESEFMELYYLVGPPFFLFTTTIGFGVGLFGDIFDDIGRRRPSSPVKSFVNIVGCTSIGMLSGIFWPISIPLLSMGTIYNKWL